MTTLTSRNGTLKFGPGHPTMLINDQPRIIDQVPQVLEELREGRIDKMVELACWGHQVGTDMVAILITHHEVDEVALLPKIAVAIHNEVGCPIGLDSRNPEAVEAALSALQPYKSIVWTVTAEQELLDTLLPIVKRYGAAVGGMPMGHHTSGIPMTAADRVAEVEVIVEAYEGYGIPHEDIVIDAICLAASALEPNAMQVTLETLRYVHDEMGISTQLGIGNAGHGMPNQTQIDLAYLLGAIPWGLDAAFVDPGTNGLIESVLALDFALGIDPYGARYIQHWRNNRVN